MDSPKHDRIERFVREHSGYIRKLATVLAPNPSMADDLAQEAFIIAFRKAESFDDEREVRPWVAGILRNLCKKAWTRSIQSGAIFRDDLAEYLENLAAEPVELPENVSRDRLMLCMEKLPERSKTLINLFYYMEMKTEEIAQRVESSATAVRMALVRIRGKLKHCMENASA